MTPKPKASPVRKTARKGRAVRKSKPVPRAPARPVSVKPAPRRQESAAAQTAAVPSLLIRTRAARFARAIPSVLVTGFTTVLLVLFLIPFVYMVMTSLKTQAQATFENSPIWPVLPPK
jgi:hypothetical protein